MKSLLFACVATLAALAAASPAAASLGGNIGSVQADRVFLKGTLKSTAKENYSVQQIETPNGVIVREYASNAGTVFGVAWQGPTRPDLRQILGPYFATFIKAVPPQMRFQLIRGPVRIQENGVIVEMGGHTRWYVGRAYVPQMFPAGVRQEGIR